jgi:hypothetical protein
MTATEKVWYARNAMLCVCNTLASVTTNSATGLYPQVTGGTVPYTMDTLIERVKIDPSPMEVEVINTLGAAQKVHEKRPEMTRGEMDLVYSDTSKALMARLYGAAVYSAAPVTTYQGGDKAIAANHRLRCAIAFRLTDTPAFTFFDDALLNNAYVTKISDVGIGGDDYGKAKIEFACLAQDFYTQDNLGDS